jgi:hypothetical protein
VEAAFKSAYADWLAYVSSPSFGPWSDDRHFVDNAPFRKIVGLGLPALPTIMQAMKEPGPREFLIYAASDITGKSFSISDFAGAGPGAWADHRVEADMWIRWWHDGAGPINRAFEESKAKWLKAATGGTGEVPLWTIETDYDSQLHILRPVEKVMTPAGEAYQWVQDQGIAVLPLLAEQFRLGAYDFLPIAFVITGGRPALPADKPLWPKEKAAAFLSWWDANKDKWTIPWPAAAQPAATPAAAPAAGEGQR